MATEERSSRSVRIWKNSSAPRVSSWTQVDPAVTGDEAAEPALVGRFGQFVDQLGAGGVTDRAALVTRRHAQADQEVGLAGARVAEQAHRFALVEVVALGQGGDGGRRHGRRREVEVAEALGAREAGFFEAPLPASFGPVVDLGGEDLGQVAQVARPGARGHLGQSGRLLAHGREVQLLGGGADGGQGSVVSGHGAASSRSS
jgi:hypothetical protein